MYIDQYICPEKFPWRYANIIANEEFIEEIMFSDVKVKSEPNALTELCKKQLHLYFLKELTIFNLPIKQRCSVFCKRVNEALIEVPYGEIKTYKDIATNVGAINSFRAVGLACSKNKLSIVVPCHRIISSNGKLTGYAGGLRTKEWLINFEMNCSWFLIFRS